MPAPCLHQPSRAYLNNFKKHTLNTNLPITTQTVVTTHQGHSPRAPKTYSLRPTSSPTTLAKVHMTTPMCHPSTLEMNPLCCISPVLINQDQANSVAEILPGQLQLGINASEKVVNCQKLSLLPRVYSVIIPNWTEYQSR